MDILCTNTDIMHQIIHTAALHSIINELDNAALLHYGVELEVVDGVFIPMQRLGVRDALFNIELKLNNYDYK